MVSGQEPDKPSSKAVFKPSKGVLPAPEVLYLYREVDPSYPTFIKDLAAKELMRNFIYEVAAVIGGILFGLALVGSFTFLVYTNHPTMAGFLLGVNALGFAGKLLGKSRRGED